jgi:guanine deaminase
MARAASGALLITGGLLTDASRRRAAPADVLVIDGIIRDVGPNLTAPEAATSFDASGLLMHPGMINAHTHGHGGLSRGQTDRVTLELLLAAGPWMSGGRNLGDKKLSTMICAAEMLLKGCTSAYDMYSEFPLPTQEGMDAAAEGYAAVGMRTVLAPMVADRSFYQAIPGLLDALPAELQREVAALVPGEGCLKALAGIAKHWRWDAEDIRLALAPTIPLHCSDTFLCGCARLSQERGLRIQTHVAESKVQAVSGQRVYGRSLLSQLAACGVVGPHFTAAHSVWLDDDDLRLMADKGASIAHNPGSNMRLGNGAARLRRMLDLGVTVGLGTDGPGSSDNQNMYEAMRAASMVSKLRSPHVAQWASVEEVYHAATIGSAAAMGRTDLGRIAPGFLADIVFLDLGALNWIPHHWTVNQLVHVEDATAVRHVMIGGRMVVRDRALLTIDVGKLRADAEAARDRLEAATARAKELAELASIYVSQHCPGLADQPFPVRNYIDQ